MIVNRMICILFIIACGIFASFYGGNISYALFYLSLFIPVISFAYTLFVYIRFKIYQSIDQHMIMKGDWVPYSSTIANEDFITYSNVKVNFLKDKSVIEDAQSNMEYNLLPGEQRKIEARLKCNYRGEYFVGIDSIEVTDFLFLFQITYPIRSKLNVVVMPRVVELKSLSIAPPQFDLKYPIWSMYAPEDELDIELRKYNPGDSKKLIHWKASAKQRELLSRKYQPKPENKIVLFMDLKKVNEDELLTIITEDQIIESILAIANYYSLKSIPVKVIYEFNGKKQMVISSKKEFQQFYKACASIRFDAKGSISEYVKEYTMSGDQGDFYVIATHVLDKDIYLTSIGAVASRNQVCILFISDDNTKESNQRISDLTMAGVKVYKVLPGDEVASILS